MANHKSGAASSGLLTDVHTEQRNPILFEVSDENGGKYVYLKGVTSTAIGSWVTFDHAGVTTLLVADAVGQVAIAMAAVTAVTSFGWYCIVSPNAGVSGKCDTIAANLAVYIDNNAGQVDDATVSGDLVLGAFSRSTDSSGSATFAIARPFVTNILG